MPESVLPVDVSSVAITFDLYYDVRSPRGTVWHRHAGPFKSLSDAREHLAGLTNNVSTNGVERHRIIETTATTRVVEEIK